MLRSPAVLIMILAACMLAFAGCGDSASEQLAEKIAEGASGADVEIDEEGGSVKIEGKDGESLEISGSEGKLPDNWPKDIDLPDGAQVKSGGSMTTDQGTMITVEATTKDSATDVMAHFKQELSGYKQVFSSSQDGTETASYDNGKQSVMLTATEDGGTTTMSAVISPSST